MSSRERISADLQWTMEFINHNQRVKCVRARMQPKMDTVITRRLTGHSFVVQRQNRFFVSERNLDRRGCRTG